MPDKIFQTSKEMHSVNGAYIRPRQELHLEIISKILACHPDPNTSPESILLGGGSASGKSSVITMFIEPYKNENLPIVYIDADEIKKMLPEYQAMSQSSDEAIKANSAFFVHDESSDIAEDILYLCIDQRKTCVYDGTMKNVEKYKRFIRDLKEASFSLRAVIVDVPLDVAIERAKNRYEIEGRFVPNDAILESHQKVAATFHQIKEEFDSYVMYDNSMPPASIFAIKESKETGEVVFDKKRWESFYAKSGINIDSVEETTQS